MNHSNLSLARRLKLQQIAVFDAVVRAGSLVAAARELHMTQPALSKTIQDLEAQFGRSLFLRTRRGVLPTEFAQMLYAHCQTVLADLRLMADDVNAWNAGVSGQVIVGSLIVASAHLLPHALVRLRKEAPDVAVVVRVGVNEIMFDELRRGRLDVVVGLLPTGQQDPGFEHVPLYEERLCAVVGRQHPFAARRSIRAEDLQSAEWILPTSTSEAMRPTVKFFETLGMSKPAKGVESVSILTNLGLLTQSQMVALMPLTVARQFEHLGLLSLLPLRHDSRFGEIGYTLDKGRERTPALHRFLAALHDAADIASASYSDPL